MSDLTPEQQAIHALGSAIVAIAQRTVQLLGTKDAQWVVDQVEVALAAVDYPRKSGGSNDS